jgi:hypothetical protein
MTKLFATLLFVLSLESIASSSFLHPVRELKFLCKSLCCSCKRLNNTEYTVNDIKEDLLELYSKQKGFPLIRAEGLNTNGIVLAVSKLIQWLRPEYTLQSEKQLQQIDINTGVVEEREKVKDIILGTTLYLVFYSPNTNAFPKARGLSLLNACIYYYSQNKEIIEESLVKYFLKTDAHYQFFFKTIEERLQNTFTIIKPLLTQKTS